MVNIFSYTEYFNMHKVEYTGYPDQIDVRHCCRYVLHFLPNATKRVAFLVKIIYQVSKILVFLLVAV